jgi:hypothetical protein
VRNQRAWREVVTAATEQAPAPVDFWFVTVSAVRVDCFSVDARSRAIDHTGGQVASLYAQSARWAVQFVAGTLGEAFAVWVAAED